MKWVAINTVGSTSLAAGAISAGWGTMFNVPSEYGTDWEGFAKRYGMRFSGIATGNLMEAGLGAAWGEDPRYIRASGQPFKRRICHVIKMTFLAQDRTGGTAPAYARFVGMAGNNFLSNTWRADSEANAGRASIRIVFGMLGRMSSNAFTEFWPDVRDRVQKDESNR